MLKAKTVLTFGAFDPLHDGHRHFLRAAAALGSRLIVVVARDASIHHYKQRPPYQSEVTRQAAVAALPAVTQVILGEAPPHEYRLLETIPFEVLAMGYDQLPSDEEVHRLLAQHGKPKVGLVRLPPYQPEQYKSSLLRES